LLRAVSACADCRFPPEVISVAVRRKSSTASRSRGT